MCGTTMQHNKLGRLDLHTIEEIWTADSRPDECSSLTISPCGRCRACQSGARFAVCNGVLTGSLLDVLEVEAGFEGVQDWAAEQSSVSATGRACNRGTTECYEERRLLAGYLTFSAVSTESQSAWRGARFAALSTPCGSYESEFHR